MYSAREGRKIDGKRMSGRLVVQNQNNIRTYKINKCIYLYTAGNCFARHIQHQVYDMNFAESL